jgi:hypothetical protein
MRIQEYLEPILALDALATGRTFKGRRPGKEGVDACFAEAVTWIRRVISMS